MTLRKFTLGILATLSVLFAASASAQQLPGTGQPVIAQAQSAQQPQGRALTSADRDFLEKATQFGLAEIEGSRLAERNATSPEVKAFAKQMITDHGKLSAERVPLASRKGITLPDDPSVMQRTELTALSALSGDAFDKMYIARIGVAGHEDTVELFREAADTAQDADIKAFAAKHLPILEEHLKMALAIQQHLERK